MVNNGVINIRDGIEEGPHHGVLYKKAYNKPAINPNDITMSEFDENELYEWVKLHYGGNKEIMRRIKIHLNNKDHHYLDVMFIILYLKKNGGWYNNEHYKPHSIELNNKLSTLLNRPMMHGKTFTQM